MNRYATFLMLVSTALLLSPCDGFGNAGDDFDSSDDFDSDEDDRAISDLMASLFGPNPETGVKATTHGELSESQRRVMTLMGDRLNELRANGTVTPGLWNRITMVGADLNGGEAGDITYVVADRATAKALHILADVLDYAWEQIGPIDINATASAANSFRG